MLIDANFVMKKWKTSPIYFKTLRPLGSYDLEIMNIRN